MRPGRLLLKTEAQPGARVPAMWQSGQGPSCQEERDELGIFLPLHMSSPHWCHGDPQCMPLCDVHTPRRGHIVPLGLQPEGTSVSLCASKLPTLSLHLLSLRARVQLCMGVHVSVCCVGRHACVPVYGACSGTCDGVPAQVLLSLGPWPVYSPCPSSTACC